MGKLINLESCDGAGKSTQIKLIKQYIEGKGLTCDFLHFPMYGHNEFSELISQFLRGDIGDIDEVDPYFVANIYAMDRFLYKKELLEKLEKYDVVLLDRYVFSNVAFQAGKYKDAEKAGIISKWIIDLEFNFLELPYPNLTLFLDVPVDILRERLDNERLGDDRNYLHGKQDIHEADLAFQSRVRDNYLILELEEQLDYHTIECAELIDVNKSNPYWNVYSPEFLFKSYKRYIKETLHI